MSNNEATFKPKKSVALSGVTAGNTALCCVGKSGNDLHYRGYNILDLADKAQFEEVAYLLIYGHLPTQAQLNAYKTKLKSLRGLPHSVKKYSPQYPRCRASYGCDALHRICHRNHSAGERRSQYCRSTGHC